MENLKGKTILVGKEPGQGRLLVAISGTGRTAAVGAPGCVPNCVSRCRPTENIAHAKIVIDRDGNMVLSNIKSQNVTFVNGSEIESKRITQTNTVELGKDRFSVSVPVILETAKKIAAASDPAPQPRPGVRKFNISHLEHVWNDLQAKRKEIQAKQKKVNLIRQGCGVFTSGAMLCIYFFGPVGYVLTVIGLLGNAYSFIGLKNDNTTDMIESLNEDFQDRYVCPNPDCNKFLGNISYKLLKKQYSMQCPYCKSEFVEK